MPTRSRGFSLVELIIVMVITGILASVMAVFIVGPMQSYFDQSRRAELVDAAEMALQRMARDARRSLPNSLVTDGTTLEMINVSDAARYRAGPGTSPVGGERDRRLEFNRADTAFNVQSPIQPTINSGDRLVVYNLGQSGADAWAGDPVITPSGLGITIGDDADVPGEWRVEMPGGHRFVLESPRQRLYVVDSAIAYQCNPDAAGGTIRRRQGAIADAPFDLSGAPRVTGHVTDCSFSYDPGTASRNAVVTLRVELTLESETVSLTRQVHVENSP